MSCVEKGPKDLREIPRHFGRAAAARDYGAWDIEIVAEINNAPRLSREEIRAAAEYFRASGADLIDIGCTPGLAFPALGDVVRELVAAGLRVSIDTFDRDEICTAVGAGAELVLSVNGSNLDVVADLAGTSARVVALPDLGGPLETLEPTLAEARAARREVPDRSDPRADRLRLHGVARALRRSPPSISGRGDADGDRQPDRADRGRFDRRQRDADRGVPGAGRAHRADDRGDSVGARRRARSSTSRAASCTTP